MDELLLRLEQMTPGNPAGRDDAWQALFADQQLWEMCVRFLRGHMRGMPLGDTLAAVRQAYGCLCRSPLPAIPANEATALGDDERQQEAARLMAHARRILACVAVISIIYHDSQNTFDLSDWVYRALRVPCSIDDPPSNLPPLLPMEWIQQVRFALDAGAHAWGGAWCVPAMPGRCCQRSDLDGHSTRGRFHRPAAERAGKPLTVSSPSRRRISRVFF